jgi:hypothetical protein
MQWQELEICCPLIQWVQAASMGMVLVNPLDMGNPIVALPLCSQPADETLLAHHLQILHQVLRGPKALPQTLEMALSQMVTALIAKTNDNKLVKLPSDKFTVTLPVLLEACKEQTLPDIWHNWANCKRNKNSKYYMKH